MLRDRRARGHIVTWVILVAASLLLLAFSDTRPLRDLRGGVNYALAPIQGALSDGARTVGSLFSAVTEIDQLRHENEQLTQELARLQQANLQIPTMIIENQRLAALLKFKSSFDHKTLAANVVYSDPSTAERVISIDRGADDGIVLGATVVSPGGALVGAVSDLGNNYAYVRLISDTRSLVIGKDIRTRATGEVKGNLSAPLEMGNIPATDDIAQGDIVVTAGGFGKDLRSQFPKDIPIGTIVEIDRNPASIVTTALVLPAADLEDLEAVLVITDFAPPKLPGSTPPPNVIATPTPEPEPTATPKPRKTPKR